MRLSRDAERRDEPWRNGRGSTREIFREPPGAGAFLWRVSLATIGEDAPFSAFPGYERAIVLADGAGFELRSDEGTIRVDSSRPVAVFSGDIELTCTLLEGPVRALNLIVHRARVRASAEILVLEQSSNAWKHFPSSPRKRGSIGSMDARLRGHDNKRAEGAPRPLHVVVCLDGRVLVDGVVLDRFDAAIIEDAEITGASADARAAFLAVLPLQ